MINIIPILHTIAIKCTIPTFSRNISSKDYSSTSIINHKRIKVRQEKFFDVLVPKINIIFEFENNNLKNVELETKEDIDNELMKGDLLRIMSLLS